MEKFFRLSLLIAGIINMLPFVIAFFPEKVASSYGVSLPDVNYELLIRHRATLFGIVGGLLIYSAITKRYYNLATAIGLISMISFILLYFSIGGINEELKKVMLIDVAATLILCLGAGTYWMSKRNSK